MDIISITREEADTFFKYNPDLIEMGFDDELIHHFHETGEVVISDEYFLGLGVYGTLVGVWCFSSFTNTILNCHAYIESDLHGQGISFDLYETMCKHIKSTAPTINKIMMTVPESCEHIMNMAKLHNFSRDGMIPNGIMWRKKPTNLHIFTKEVI